MNYFWRSTSRVVAVAALALTMGTTVASATVIQFGQSDSAVNSGRLSYGGNGGPLFGQTIGLDQIALGEASQPPAGNDDFLACFGCALNFNTGLNTMEGPSEWQFNTLASNFQITGDAYALNSNGTLADTPIASGTLLSGGFDETQQLVLGESGSTTEFGFTGAGIDQKATGLLNYFGVDTGLQSTFETFLTGMVTRNSPAGGLTANVDRALITNSVGNTPSTVPEPSSWLILCLGVLLLAVGCRQRHSGGLTT